jgi:hypothetical protein
VARQIIEKVTDDFDGTEPAETVRIGWQGEWREIDLGERNMAALSRGFDRFWEKARTIRNGSTLTKRGGAGGRGKSGQDNRAIRVWADENGVAVPSRGRIPRHVVEQYNRATAR